MGCDTMQWDGMSYNSCPSHLIPFHAIPPMSSQRGETTILLYLIIYIINTDWHWCILSGQTDRHTEWLTAHQWAMSISCLGSSMAGGWQWLWFPRIYVYLWWKLLIWVFVVLVVVVGYLFWNSSHLGYGPKAYFRKFNWVDQTAHYKYGHCGAVTYNLIIS